MNIDFEAALKYIDLGNYEKAVEKLNSAINAVGDETDEGMQYRCVLGELYANMGMVNLSHDEFVKVMNYSEDHNTLTAQRNIAKTYLDAFAGNLPMPEKKTGRPGDAPLVPKPRQNAAFIARQTRKHK